jgi:hypothetical protein
MQSNLVLPFPTRNMPQKQDIDYLRAYRALIKGFVAASINRELKMSTDLRNKQGEHEDANTSKRLTKGR